MKIAYYEKLLHPDGVGQNPKLAECFEVPERGLFLLLRWLDPSSPYGTFLDHTGIRWGDPDGLGVEGTCLAPLCTGMDMAVHSDVAAFLRSQAGPS